MNNERMSSTPTPNQDIEQRINEIERASIGEDSGERIDIIAAQENNERVGDANVAKPELLRAMAFLYENYNPDAGTGSFWRPYER